MSDAAPPARPRVLEGAVLAVVAAGVVNGVQSAALLGRVGAARDEVARSAAGSADAVAATLTAIAVVGVVYSLALVALALLLRQGRPWARTALVVVSPLSLLGAVTLTTPGITTAILVGLAVYMLFRREVVEWVAEVRRRRATDPL